MFGFRYIKSAPSDYLMQVRDGQVVREGAGLAFFYFAPRSTLVSVPTTVNEVPFMFEEITRDFQSVTLQGQVSFRISDPKLISQQMNYALLPSGTYASDEPEKLPLRVLNAVKAQFRGMLQELDLKGLLQATEQLAHSARQRLASAPAIRELGLQIIDLSILAVKPTPETARALQEARDRSMLIDATYGRRNAAIEQERIVKENELRSELSVEQKKREVQENRIESERALLEKRQQVQAQEMAGKVKLEQQNAELVALEGENERREAETRAYGIRTMADALQGIDPRTLQALTMANASPEAMMALGFQNLADNAAKIGEFNFSPDLLRQLASKRA